MSRDAEGAALAAMQAAREVEDSPVVAFLGIVWGAWVAWGGRSYPQLNRSMRRALEAAIMIGMPFEKNDIAEIARRFRWSYWSSDPEALYAMAAIGLKSHTGRLPRNISAAQSFEHYWARPPYILNGQRLVVGSSFQWEEGERVKVTTLASGGMVACSYREWSPGPGRIKRRFTITRAELKAAEKAAREAEKPRSSSSSLVPPAPEES